MIVRDFAAADAAQVRELLIAAFPTAAEADLVEQLRTDGDAAIELVADRGRIAGHVLFSRMSTPFRALALAPVAVCPERQRSGIGSALIGAGHDRARAGGWQGIFVLGNPAYYTRFGYSLEAARGFDSPYAGPHFMLLVLAHGLPSYRAMRHARAFTAL